jgi:hypothetical protein
MGRNLIYVSELNRFGYTFNFGNGNLVVCFKSVLEFCVMDCICWMQMNCLLIIGSKCSKKDENPSMLWHKCLGHIFRPRIQRLIKDNIYPF